MKNSGMTFSLGLLVLAVCTVLQAEEIPPRGPISFSVYDKDGNGSISEAEFNAVRSERMSQRAADGMPMRNAGNAPMFSVFDSNGDGQLTPEELSAGQQSQMGTRGGMGPGSGTGPGAGMRPGRNMPTFAEYDLDSNGVIGEQEFYEARSKRISERAQQGYPMRNVGNAPPFTEIDRNSDGVINQDEFASYQQQHRRMPMQ